MGRFQQNIQHDGYTRYTSESEIRITSFQSPQVLQIRWHAELTDDQLPAVCSL